MKVNLFETHDRYQHFTKQNFSISECCQDLINQKPFGDHAFYIFAHPRTIELDEKFKLFKSGLYASFEDVPDKTIIWQPRLTKPKAQTNSMLFKAYPGMDRIKIIWMIPDRELWKQYGEGKVASNEAIAQSIFDFEHNRAMLECKEFDDLDDAVIDGIYQSIARSAKKSNGKLIL